MFSLAAFNSFEIKLNKQNTSFMRTAGNKQPGKDMWSI